MKLINFNPDTEDRLHDKTKIKTLTQMQSHKNHKTQTASTNPDTEDRLHEKTQPTHDKIINSSFTSFEEVRRKRQTGQNNYIKNVLRRGFFNC